MKNTLPKKKKIYKSITYLGNISKKISKIMSKHTSSVLRVKYYRNISFSLINAKEKTMYIHNSSIYKLECS